MASEIVIGLDFGTTHSGVSWAVNSGVKRIYLVNDWENTTGANSNTDKVPSWISYAGNEPNAWGYMAEKNPFKWIKLLLDPEHQYARAVKDVQVANIMLSKLNKNAIQVVTDYLRLVWEHALEDIARKQGPDWKSIYKLKVVLTVPAIWSPLAKDRTMQAAKAAGLPEDMDLVTEPEAAALATLKDKADMEEIEEGSAFVVCDAGGGTVDLISYEVTGTEPLELRECAVGSGGLCGSVFVDMGFEKWIKMKVGEAKYNSIGEKHRRKMMSDFEYRIKRHFTGDSRKNFSIELRGAGDDPDEDDDAILVKGTALCAIFEHVCGQIDTLVENQVKEVQSKDIPVKAILLVGGFGECKYLQDRLNRIYRSRGINVLQVNGAWSAICRGATMWGLENSSRRPSSAKKTIQARLARYSYGYCHRSPYDNNVHLPIDRVFDPAENIWKADNQMSWLLKRGDVIEEGSVLPYQLYVNVEGVGFLTAGTRNFGFELCYCEDLVPPSRKIDSVKALCSVDFSIGTEKIWVERSYKSTFDKKKWRRCTFDVAIILGNAALDFVVRYRGELAGSCEAKYLEKFDTT